MKYGACYHSWPLFRELRLPCGHIGLTQETQRGLNTSEGGLLLPDAEAAHVVMQVMFFSKRVRTKPLLHDRNQTIRRLKCIGLSVPSLFWYCTICHMLHWDSHEVFISVVSESLCCSIGVKST